MDRISPFNKIKVKGEITTVLILVQIVEKLLHTRKKMAQRKIFQFRKKIQYLKTAIAMKNAKQRILELKIALKNKAHKVKSRVLIRQSSSGFKQIPKMIAYYLDLQVLNLIS